MAATDIELPQNDAVVVPDVGHRCDHAADCLVVVVRVGDLRSEMAVQPDEVQRRLIEYPPYRAGCLATRQGEPELLIEYPGRQCAVTMDVDIRNHAYQNPLAAAHMPGKECDFSRGIHHNPPDSDHRSVQQFVGRFRVAVHDDPGRIDPAGQRD